MAQLASCLRFSTGSFSASKIRTNGVSLSRFRGFQSVTPLTNPLRVVLPVKERKQDPVVCASLTLNAQTLQWASAISTGVLMLAKGTAIHKSFLVPLFALQAPASVISWIKGDYGMWTAFLALLVRLFYFIPGELELPFLTMLLVITAPLQAMYLRGTQAGTILSLAIAAYLALQHFSRAGSLRRAFDQGSIVATLAIVCITAVPFFFLM
ncbi:hypothetical protein LUZ60_008217 [Juncus effusus]|nr:hypothetical protein LUZ60_008217 [Juncus effusus]